MRKLKGILDAHEQMIVVGEKDEGVNLNLEESLSTTEDPERDRLELFRWPEQIPPLDRPAGDLDKGTAFRDKSKSSRHDLLDVVCFRDLSESGGT